MCRFWTFCPLRDLSPLQGPLRADRLTGTFLTGRPPYGKAPYGEASYEKAPYELQESLREATGRDFTRIGREFPLVRRRPKKVGPFPLTGALTGRPVSYEKTPYELQESLREATGRDFTRIGWEFPLVRRRPKKGRFFLGLCRFWTFCPFRDLSPLQGPLRADRLAGRPLTGRLLTRRPLTNYRKAYGKLRGRDFTRIGRERSFFPRAVPFLDLLPFQGPFPLTGALTGKPPYGKAPYGEASYEKAPYGEASYGRHL